MAAVGGRPGDDMSGSSWLARRTLAVIRREGVIGTVQRVVKHGRIAIGLPSRESRDYRRRKEAADRAFDEARGVDTGGTQHLIDLTIRSANAALGVSHIATGPAHFRAAMRTLDVDPRGYAFVDLGSGKGRALLMAAEYPFAKIVGVEFAEELHAICQQNLARVGDPRLSCRLGDAENYEFPSGNLVVFMNNPFDKPVVQRIATRLANSGDADRSVTRLVYVNPRAPEVFADPPWFDVGSTDGVRVFGLRPPV